MPNTSPQGWVYGGSGIALPRTASGTKLEYPELDPQNTQNPLHLAPQTIKMRTLLAPGLRFMRDSGQHK